MTYAEGLYRRTHIKQVESTEDYLNRVTKAYNEIGKLIGKLSTSKDYIMLEQKRQELSRIYMDSFMLRQALQRVTLIDGEKIETDKKIMTPKLQEGENLFD